MRPSGLMAFIIREAGEACHRGGSSPPKIKTGSHVSRVIFHEAAFLRPVTALTKQKSAKGAKRKIRERKAKKCVFLYFDVRFCSARFLWFLFSCPLETESFPPCGAQWFCVCCGVAEIHADFYISRAFVTMKNDPSARSQLWHRLDGASCCVVF